MGLEFTTAKRRVQPITFTLDGREFSFTPPKSAVMVLPVLDKSANDADMVRATFDWLGAGLPEEDVQYLMDRLKDPEDDLDIDQIGEVIEALGEEIAGRPTT